MSKGKSQNKTANFETAMSSWTAANFSWLLYAGIEDLAADNHMPRPYPLVEYESLDNIKRPKTQQTMSKSLFTIGSGMKKMFTNIVKSFIAEISECDLVAADTIETIVEKLTARMATGDSSQCLTVCMHKLVNSRGGSCGAKICDERSESSSPLREMIYPLLPEIMRKFGAKFQAELADFCALFFATVAMMAAAAKWFDNRPLAPGIVFGALHECGLRGEALAAVVRSAEVEKKPAKPRKSAETAETVETNATPDSVPAVDSSQVSTLLDTLMTSNSQ